MKKALLTLVFIFIFFLGFKYSSYAANRVTNQRCLTITGTFTAKNWVGGSMMVGCGGDNGKYCKGQIEKVKPGKKFTLSKCSCPPYASGCLVIGRNLKLKNDGPQKRPRVRVIGDRVPNKCKLDVKKNVCGRNGDVITGNFKVTCKKDVCPVPPQVLNVKVTCPNCVSENLEKPIVEIKVANLECTSTVNDNLMRLDWKSISGAQSYIIYKSDKADSGFTVYKTITDNFYEEKLSSSTYLTYFAVEAKKGTNLSGKSNSVFSGPVPTLCPSPTGEEN